jgi:molybdate transport system ATP-binding protein
MTRLTFACRHCYPSGFELDARFGAGDGTTAVFGPSGGGKSTILGLIAGILRPQAGQICLAGQILVDTASRIFLPPEQRRIGMVFQDHLLFPHLTVAQNLRYGLRRRPGRRIDFNRVAIILEIDGLLDRLPHTLSGGQRQRVALGRALLRGPDLLLMDEPLTALDEGLKERVLTYLERAVAEWRIPTLFVSHDQADVRRLADHVVVLESGKVREAGPTGPTLDRIVAARTPGFPTPVNLLRVTEVHATGGHWEGKVGGQALQLPASSTLRPGGSAFVEFRPRDVILSNADVSGLSVRNHLHGRVREVVPLPDRTLVAVDVGQFLWAEITAEAARDLDVRPDKPIVCLIKTTAVVVGG